MSVEAILFVLFCGAASLIVTSRLWRKRTTLKRCRTLESVFAGIALFSLVSGLAADICNKTECLRTASTVLGRMNTEIRPCDDFYQFACGSFINKTQLGENKGLITTISEMEDAVKEQMLAVMQERRPETDPEYLKFPNILYRACTNRSLIENLGANPMQRITNILGSWPVSRRCRWDRNWVWNWENIIKKFRDLGFNTDYIMKFSIEKDPYNATKHIINLDQPLLGFNQFILTHGFNNSLVSAYFDYMVDIAVLFGADNATAKIALRKSLEFEIKLAKIFKPPSGKTTTPDMFNLRSIKQMQVLYPYVQWLNYINALLPKNLTVTEDEIINVSVPSFFEKLGPLLQSTDNRDIADYLMWRIHEYAAGFLSQEFRTRKSQFQTALPASLFEGSESEDCYNVVLSRLSISIDSLYLRKHFKRDTKPAVLEMVTNISTAFGEILNETQWMDHETKRKSKIKLNLIKNIIGHTDELLNENFLEEHYRKLNMDPNKYFESCLNINVFDTDESFSKLKFPVNATNWKAYRRPAAVEASYEATKNSIEFAASFLQGHFFNIHLPKYMNYGGIGSVIGHEITHGFVGKGSWYDGNGNGDFWWQNRARRNFKKKAQCLINQYGNFTDKQTNLTLQSENNVDENCCDQGGIKSSYLAYEQWLAQNGEEHKLPGLNYTSRQMYWIAAAQNQCAKYSHSHSSFAIFYSNHALPEFRVLGTFSNMKDFSRDFQCANGTSMNPVKKCDVW